VAAIEPQTAQATADTAARLARDLGARLVFVSVLPRRPDAREGRPHASRWTSDLIRSRKALDTALAAARRHGVTSYGEIVEGDAATEIVAFANARNARLLVVGKRRRRSCTAPARAAGSPPGVSGRVVGCADLPVVVASCEPGVGDPAGVAPQPRLG
jgi:nucleotide-binding universal stress UspA family protein